MLIIDRLKSWSIRRRQRGLKAQIALVQLDNDILRNDIKDISITCRNAFALVKTIAVRIETLDSTILSLAAKTEQRYLEMEARKVRDEEMLKPTKHDETY